ncbi:MAG: SHOCT domain-containing protein [Phycisphaerae bacterium]|nr:SHOCT domain-containing protein [Phycisphaerae bacterium]
MEDIIVIAAGKAGFSFTELAIWAGIFVLVMVLGFVVVVLLRKKMLADDRASESGFAMTIEQVEQMHDKGMISDEEFAAMRRGILGIGAPEKKSPESEDEI